MKDIVKIIALSRKTRYAWPCLQDIHGLVSVTPPPLPISCISNKLLFGNL